MNYGTKQDKACANGYNKYNKEQLYLCFNYTQITFKI